jgi:hypothetical protein
MDLGAYHKAGYDAKWMVDPIFMDQFSYPLPRKKVLQHAYALSTSGYARLVLASCTKVYSVAQTNNLDCAVNKCFILRSEDINWLKVRSFQHSHDKAQGNVLRTRPTKQHLESEFIPRTLHVGCARWGWSCGGGVCL